MKAYFFSLETLVAVTILLSSLFIIHFIPTEFDNKEERTYTALNFLEEENKLRDKTDELVEFELENLLDFDVRINKDCTNGIVDYLIVEGVNEFRVIRVCY